MRYASIRSCDINNGEGLMVTLWTQGCSVRCSEKCHNKHLWSFDGGKEFTEDTIKEIISLLDSPQNFACLGGEPLEPCNLDMLLELFKTIKNIYPQKKIWLWTGKLFDNVKKIEALKYVDYMTDGGYVDSLHKEGLLWRGSSNQRNIDVQESLKLNKVVLSKYN